MRFNWNWMARILLAPDNDGAGGGGGTADAVVAEVKAEPVVNIKEVVELRKESRASAAKADALDGKVSQLTAMVEKLVGVVSGKTEAKKTEPATEADASAAKVDQRIAALDFREALADAGVTSPKQREALTRMRKADPDAPLAEWMAGALELIDFKPKQEIKVADPKKPIEAAAATDSGAAVAATKVEKAANPFQWTPEQGAAASPEEFMQAWDAHIKSRRGHFEDPYKNLRRDHSGAASTGALAKAIADQLKR